MELVLSIAAVGLLCWAGMGGVLLLMPKNRRTNLTELISLSLLFGSGFIAFLSFGFGFLLTGFILRWTLALCCMAVGMAGFLRLKNKQVVLAFPDWTDRRSWIGPLVLALPGIVVFWVAFHQALGWDGLFVWEIKARLARLSGGAIPLSYYSDPILWWSHPEYPLLLPLTESWLYTWLGECDQSFLKILFPAFFMAGSGLLLTGVARHGGREWKGWLAALLPFFVPATGFGEGAATGYADVPMAVFFLGCAVYLLEYMQNSDRAILPLIGCMGACLVCIKQEGILLWLCVMIAFLVHMLRHRIPKSYAWFGVPAVLLWLAWHIFLGFLNVPKGTDFQPMTPFTLWAQRDRFWELAVWLWVELFQWRTWGLLWLLFFSGLLLPGDKKNTEQKIAAACLVLLPLVMFAGIFVFSRWIPYTDHLRIALPRLMNQLTFCAVLFIALSLPDRLAFRGRQAIAEGSDA